MRCGGNATRHASGAPDRVPAAGDRALWPDGSRGICAGGWSTAELSRFAEWVTYGLLGLEQGQPSAGRRRVLPVRHAQGAYAVDPGCLRRRGDPILLHAGADPSHPGRQAGIRRATSWPALLGIVTPFCSCSAVPLFIGFVTAGVPLGVTFSFLISAPMVNEIALVLLYGLFGWKVAAIYLGTGLGIAILAGWVIGRLHMEPHVEPWVYATKLGVGGVEEEAGLVRSHPVWPRCGAGDRGEGVALRGAGDRRRGGDSRLRSGELHGLHHGEGGLVVGPACGAHRDPDVLECRRDHPRGAGAARARGRRWGPFWPS